MYKIIILTILFLLLVLVYLKRNSINELFQSKQTIGFKMINPNNSKKVIDNVPNYNFYSDLDRDLRNIDETVTVKNHYKKSLVDWTKPEIKLFQWLADAIIKKTPKQYLFLYENILVAKYKDKIEQDFPHTQGDCIFFTGAYIKRILPYYNNNDLDNCVFDIGMVVIHECIHIMQRRQKEFFDLLYKKWNFTNYDQIINFSKVSKQSRYNPDGTDLNWSYRLENGREFIPIAIYNDSPINIGSVNQVGVFIEKLGSKAIIPPFKEIEHLNKIDEYSKFFGDVGNNNYHPNELSAEIISRLIIKEMIEDDKLKLNSEFTRKYTNSFKEKTMAEVVFYTVFKNY